MQWWRSIKHVTVVIIAVNVRHCTSEGYSAGATRAALVLLDYDDSGRNGAFPVVPTRHRLLVALARQLLPLLGGASKNSDTHSVSGSALNKPIEMLHNLERDG